MGLRFRKSIKIFPGVRVNLSKSGPSLSLGGGGVTLNYSKRGVRTSADLPGGLSYTKLYGDDQKSSAGGKSNADAESAQQKLDVDFLSRLTMTGAEEDLVNGLKAFTTGHSEEALAHLSKATEIADAAFLAGALALSLGKNAESLQYLQQAAAHKNELGEHFKKYGVSSEVEVPITEEISVLQEADERGLALLLAEAYQQTGDLEKAIAAMQDLCHLVPDDVVARLSLVEMLTDKSGTEVETCKEIVGLVGELSNDSPFHTMLLLYKARALRQLGLNDIAKQTLTNALRRKKDRDVAILNALRYERALLLEAIGQTADARKDFEAIFASDAHYEDVSQRLNITG
ncbi:MAG: DUF4236 domain-containing protein [Chloroflexi bacterium]|nr:DUF4236 domain-containing protein [Chloroflexota bacterium]